MSNKKVPESTISRLFLYLREITELAKINIKTISSSELGDRTNLGDAQVRKDLGYFGQFGVTGAGYSIADLKKSLEKILGKDKKWNVALIGTGHLGTALLAYSGFGRHELDIVAAFDADAKKIGKKFGDITVRPISELEKLTKEKNITLSIIAVPAAEAQGVAETIIKAGIECILNFAPVSLNVPEGVKVRNVDFSRELEILSYFAANKGNGRETLK